MTLRVRKNFQASTEPKPALYVCSTPIGNLGDASARLIDTLRQCDVIAAEDTRQTRKLLSRFDIHPAVLVSCHEHNQMGRRETFIEWWQAGKTIAMVSDAGTPLISDPGWSVVDAAIEQGVPVIPVPGPSAILAALVGSQLPAQPFAFFGFLPRAKSEAARVLATAIAFPGTVIFYEAPHRLISTLKRLSEHIPNRQMTLAKELTKTHETFIDGTVQEVLAYMESEGPRGEYVLLFSPPELSTTEGDAKAEEHTLAQARGLVEQYMAGGDSHAQAVRLVATQLGMKRRTLYQQTLDIAAGVADGDVDP